MSNGNKGSHQEASNRIREVPSRPRHQTLEESHDAYQRNHNVPYPENATARRKSQFVNESAEERVHQCNLSVFLFTSVQEQNAFLQQFITHDKDCYNYLFILATSHE